MMSKRALLLLFAFVVLAFGLGCLNYTRAEGLEHHREWAVEHGLPEPGPNLFFLGVAAVVLGSGTFGFALRGR